MNLRVVSTWCSMQCPIVIENCAATTGKVGGKSGVCSRGWVCFSSCCTLTTHIGCIQPVDVHIQHRASTYNLLTHQPPAIEQPVVDLTIIVCIAAKQPRHSLNMWWLRCIEFGRSGQRLAARLQPLHIAAVTQPHAMSPARATTGSIDQ